MCVIHSSGLLYLFPPTFIFPGEKGDEKKVINMGKKIHDCRKDNIIYTVMYKIIIIHNIKMMFVGKNI